MILHEQKLVGLHHRLVSFVRLAAQLVHYDLMVVSGFRSDPEQLHLYEKGRTIMGEPPVDEAHPLGHTVTNAMTARETPHGRRCAVDLCPVMDGRCLWGDEPKFKALAIIAKRQGLQWGGDFKDPRTGKPMRDLGHFQTDNWRTAPYP